MLDIKHLSNGHAFLNIIPNSVCVCLPWCNNALKDQLSSDEVNNHKFKEQIILHTRTSWVYFKMVSRLLFLNKHRSVVIKDHSVFPIRDFSFFCCFQCPLRAHASFLWNWVSLLSVQQNVFSKYALNVFKGDWQQAALPICIKAPVHVKLLISYDRLCY